MELQAAFNIAVALLGTLGGWVLNTIWRSMRDLQLADEAIVTNVQRVEILVASHYPTRGEINDKFSVVAETLIRIEDKLDRKVDRRDWKHD